MRTAEIGILQVLNVEAGIHAVIGLNIEHILNSASLRRATALFNFIDAKPIATSLIREEEHRIVHRSLIDGLDKVAIACATALAAYAATALRLELIQIRALDIAHVAKGDDDIVVGIEVFGIEVDASLQDFRTTGIAVFLLYLGEFVLHHLFTKLGVRQNLGIVGNLLLQLGIFRMELLLLQCGELPETHLNDIARLHIVEAETLLQPRDGNSRSLARTDDAYHLVDIVRSHNQGFKQMGAFLSLALIVFCTADDYIMTMLHKIADAVFQRKQCRTHFHGRRARNGHEGNRIDSEGCLKCSEFEELIQHNIGILTTTHIDYNAHTLTVRLIVDVRDAVYLSFLRELSYVRTEFGSIRAIGNLANDYLIVKRSCFNLCLGTHDNASASRLVGTSDAFRSHDIATCGEVRTFDVLHQPVQIDVRIVNIGNSSIDDLTDVMRRDIGCHTNGNTRSTIDEERRNARGQNTGLGARVVVVRHHIHRLLLDVLHHHFSHDGELCLRITHGSRTVAVHRTEVTLTNDEGIAHCPRLGHTYQCTIYRAVAVGMVFSEYFAHYGR